MLVCLRRLRAEDRERGEGADRALKATWNVGSVRRIAARIEMRPPRCYQRIWRYTISPWHRHKHYPFPPSLCPQTRPQIGSHLLSILVHHTNHNHNHFPMDSLSPTTSTHGCTLQGDALGLKLLPPTPPHTKTAEVWSVNRVEI